MNLPQSVHDVQRCCDEFYEIESDVREGIALVIVVARPRRGRRL